MAVKIKLARFGRTGRPFYRVVIAEERQKRGGRAIEELGFYDPSTNPPTLKIDRVRLKKWQSVGAQPTDPVRKLLAL